MTSDERVAAIRAAGDITVAAINRANKYIALHEAPEYFKRITAGILDELDARDRGQPAAGVRV